MPYFTPRLFAFLRDIKQHNDRAWFEDNRARFTADVETPLLEFIAAMAPRLHAISPAIVVNPRRMGGSMYRFYRDTRFSADKSPFKTHVAAHFAHSGKRTNPAVPGFYLHLEPGHCMGGGGIYHPAPQALSRLRLAIAEDTKGWAAVKKRGLDIHGETLKRAPVGFDPAHPHVEDLKRKDHYAIETYTEADACGEDFLDRYADTCDRVAPLVAFIAKSLGLRW